LKVLECFIKVNHGRADSDDGREEAQVVVVFVVAVVVVVFLILLVVVVDPVLSESGPDAKKWMSLGK
jgi:hypothetical protein